MPDKRGCCRSQRSSSLSLRDVTLRSPGNNGTVPGGWIITKCPISVVATVSSLTSPVVGGEYARIRIQVALVALTLKGPQSTRTHLQSEPHHKITSRTPLWKDSTRWQTRPACDLTRPVVRAVRLHPWHPYYDAGHVCRYMLFGIIRLASSLS